MRVQSPASALCWGYRNTPHHEGVSFRRKQEVTQCSQGSSVDSGWEERETEGTYINDHAHGGQGGSEVLCMRRPHRHRYTPCIQAAIECSDQLDACETEDIVRGVT